MSLIILYINSVVESNIFISSPGPRIRKSELQLRLSLVLQDTSKITFFDLMD
jgi:hypothetical protein